MLPPSVVAPTLTAMFVQVMETIGILCPPAPKMWQSNWPVLSRYDTRSMHANVLEGVISCRRCGDTPTTTAGEGLRFSLQLISDCSSQDRKHCASVSLQFKESCLAKQPGLGCQDLSQMPCEKVGGSWGGCNGDDGWTCRMVDGHLGSLSAGVLESDSVWA